MVARASALCQESIAPAYDEDAGHQLALATVRGNPKAGAFLRACGELDYTKLYFETVEADWQERLEALLQVKETVGGSRPGG